MTGGNPLQQLALCCVTRLGGNAGPPAMLQMFIALTASLYEYYVGVSKSFQTGRLERELQMVQPSAARCSIAIL